eukprot:TRINITY_DN24561_c0_g1_i3.p1 TRINITY_DN24561_c0_g1~~TRINITY_DN24561_c0_g1_i3.p1  ORF type:complete len:425 (-),score=87.42 TRINITY_DN24561_c0_g1_i3:271-1506(-)
MRDAAAEVLSEVCTKYACIVQIEQQAISMLIKNGFNLQNRSLQTLYGVIQGFRELGVQQVRKFLIPNCFSIVQELNVEMEQKNDQFRQKDAYVVYDVLLKAVGEAILDEINQEKKLNQNQNQVLFNSKISKLKVFQNVDGFFSKRKISKENNEQNSLEDTPEIKRSKIGVHSSDNNNDVQNDQINQKNPENKQILGDSQEKSLSKITGKEEDATDIKNNEEQIEKKLQNSEISPQNQKQEQNIENSQKIQQETENTRQKQKEVEDLEKLCQQNETQMEVENENTDVQIKNSQIVENQQNDQIDIQIKNSENEQNLKDQQMDVQPIKKCQNEDNLQVNQMDTEALKSSQIDEHQVDKKEGGLKFRDTEDISQLQVMSMLADDAKLDEKIVALQILFGENILQYIPNEYIIGV